MNLNPAVETVHRVLTPLTDVWRSFTDRFPIHIAPAQYDPPPVPNTRDGVAELFLHPPAKGATDGLSFDVDCLIVQAYAKLTSYPHVVRHTINSDMSPNSRLPVLVTADGRLLSGSEVVDEISSKASTNLWECVDSANAHVLLDRLWPINVFLRNFQAYRQTTSDELAFIALANLRLRAAFLYHFLLSPPNFNHITQPWYDSHFPSPLSMILGWMEQSKAQRWVAARQPITRKDELLTSARIALVSISTHITARPPDLPPSLLDATIFAYLHHALSIKTPDTGFTKVAAGGSEVVSLCKRMYVQVTREVP
ncbi:metaxin 1 [Gonapodya sp. JEL0774]|nr:metaxin 1 [Gonapodya sp. JEL0774]